MQKTYRFLGINHVGVVAKSHDLLFDFLHKKCGINQVSNEDSTVQQTRTTIIPTDESSHGTKEPMQSQIELLQAIDGNGPIAKYIAKKSHGIHHIAINVDNIEALYRHLNEQGINLIGEGIGNGVQNTKVFFVHPNDTGGILIEFVQSDN